MKEKEKKFNDNTLNEFSNAVAEFLEKYDTKKSNAHIFCIITEEDGKEMNTVSHIKGAPLQIVNSVNYVINNDKTLKMANFVNSFLTFGKMKSDNKDDVVKTLDLLKSLTK